MNSKDIMDSIIRSHRIGPIFVLLLALCALAPIGISYWIFLQPRDALDSFQHHFNLAQWIQALIALFAFVFSGLTLASVALVALQLKYQREQVDRDLYRPLIGAQHFSAKRLLYSPRVREVLEGVLRRLEKPESLSRDDCRGMLEQLREDVRDAAEKICLPLLGQKGSFDHIEALINEYNFLCKLISDGVLSKDFATEQGLENFDKVYESVFPIIKLRWMIAQNRLYASHFTRHIERKKVPGKPLK